MDDNQSLNFMANKTYKANDIFLKSCSGIPVRNTVEHPPFNCPVTVGFDCCICPIFAVPGIAWVKP